MSKQNEANKKLLTRIEKCLSRAGSCLMGPETTEMDVTDAFVQVVVIWFLFQYVLQEHYNVTVPKRQMLESNKFLEVWPRVQALVDQVLYVHDRN